MSNLKFETPNIITVEDYVEEYLSSGGTDDANDIAAAINFTFIQLDSYCINLSKCWYETDTKSPYYRNEEEKAFIQKAFLIQTKFNLDRNLDLSENKNFAYGQGGLSFSENKNKKTFVLEEVKSLLTKAKVFSLNFSNIEMNSNNNDQLPKDILNFITTLEGIFDKRYVKQTIDNHIGYSISGYHDGKSVLISIDLLKELLQMLEKKV